MHISWDIMNFLEASCDKVVHLVIDVYHGDFQLGLVCGLLYFEPNPFVPRLLFCLPNDLHLVLQSFAIVHPTHFSVL